MTGALVDSIRELEQKCVASGVEPDCRTELDMALKVAESIDESNKANAMLYSQLRLLVGDIRRRLMKDDGSGEYLDMLRTVTGG